MKIEGVSARTLEDTRGEETIKVFVKTSFGLFEASAPNGKSTGKYEAPSYKKSLSGDIKKLKEISDYFSKLKIEKFDDLEKIEELATEFVGANTMFALESAILKALAFEQEKSVWQLINPKTKKTPQFMGNCIGGGKHSQGKKVPDFQEFLVVCEDPKIMHEIQQAAKKFLEKQDENFEGKKNDENAWQTSLNEKEVLEILKRLKEKFDFNISLDVAASSFYSRKKYKYQNPVLERTQEEQFSYMKSLAEHFEIFSIEDPFEEQDFESFAELHKACHKTIIVGDDLTTTNPKRLQKAIEEKSISGIIVKPNQIGSLIKVKEVCEMADKNHIKKIFSHRSGETSESILADLAVGFQAEYLKCGIAGTGREEKINRILEIKQEMKK